MRGECASSIPDEKCDYPDLNTEARPTAKPLSRSAQKFQGIGVLTRAGPKEVARLCRQVSILIPFVPQDVQGSVFSTGFVRGAAQSSLSKRSSTDYYLNAMCAFCHSISA